MRISTSMLYRRGIQWMNDHQAGIAKAQEQISSGKKLLKPSDDPTNSARLMELHKQIQLNEQYGRNIIMANGRQSLEEVAMQDSIDILQEARVLTIQANNATLNFENRQSIARQIEQLRQQLLDNANARDPEGAFLFAGFKEQSQPFSNTAGGDVVYNGDQGQRSLQIGPSRQVASSDPGDEVFMLIRNGNGQFRTSLDSSNIGNGKITVGSVTNPTLFRSAFMKGDYPYTLQFTVNAADFTTYEVRDSANNLVDPPGAAQLYIPGETIAFNGIEVVVDGETFTGDRFIVKPAENQSLFKTLDNLINALGLPGKTAADAAKLTHALDSALTDLDQGLLNLNQVRGRIGSRMNALDAQEEVNRNFNVQLQKLQGDIGAVDYAEAASRLSQELLALQASQQSFVKIQNLSLFNYLR